jgi:hypothetical protein
MTFNPKQPRADDGRWVHLAGLMKSEGGFTHLMSGGQATKGYAVGVPSKDGKDWRALPHGSTDAAALQQFASDFGDELSKPNRAIGGWSNSNPDWGDVRDALDVVEVHDDLAKAALAAQAAGQDAIFDLEHGEEIPTTDALKRAKKGKKMDLSITTPMFEGEWDLSAQDGKIAFWKQILPKKQIHYTAKDGSRQTLNFDDRYLTDLANNKAVDKIGFLLADKDNAHTMDPERFRGEVAAMEVREDGLYGKIVFPSREAAKAVLDNPDLGVSARIREGIQRSDGSTISRGIIHVLGTLDPQVSGMSGWQTADLSTEAGDVLDLTDSNYEDTTMAFDPNRSVLDYTDEDIAAFTDEETDAYIEACATELGVILGEPEDLDEDLDEDETTERQPEMALSNEAQREIDLARSTANEALRRLAAEKWNSDREKYLLAGVPPHLLDLAIPVLNRADEMVIDLSNSDEDDVNVSAIVRGLLDAAKGTVDLSTESGHSGTFVIGSGEDPDAELLDLWDKQS